MIDTKAIRNKILDLAVRGKLTEQLPEDGTAEELYQQIQSEKQALIKAGKIKKEKPFSESPVFKPYPFEIPTSWKFVRFGELMINRDSERIPVSVADRQTRKKVYDYYGASGVIDKIDDFLFDKELLLIGEDGANLLARSTPIAFIASGHYWVNNHAHVLDVCTGTNLKYVCRYINTISLDKYVTGSAQPKINQENMNAIWVALPPLAEQKRIVEKVEQAFSVLDIIDELQKKYADNMTVLKSRLIDLAIRGKLTEQLPEDGTAEELYQQIQVEKQALIKAGKIKKEKPLPEINENEIPFEIPDNWKWGRLQEITSNLTLNDGDWVLSDDMVPIGDVKLVQLGSIGDLQYKDKGFKYLTLQRFKELNGKQIFPGYLLINRLVADKMLLCIIPPIDGILMTAVDVCWVAPQEKYYDIKYLMYTLSSSSIQQKVKEVGYGVTRFRISKTNLISIPFPFPPFSEQKRIVERLDKLLALCDN